MKKHNHQKLIRILFIIAGSLLIADTIFARLCSNMNLGVVLPAVLGAPLLLYGIFKSPLDCWFTGKPGKIIKWVFLTGYFFLIAVLIVFCTMMSVAASTKPDPGADAVIVLGAAVHGDKVTDALGKRLDKALQYYNENPGSIIVTTGGMGHGENLPEAEAMQKYLLERGVPAADILVENRATSTNENFNYSKQLLDERFGAEQYRVVYVTNDFHILRAGMNAKDEGLQQAQGLAAPTPVFTIPNAYLRESLALLATYAFGTSVSSTV